MCQIWNRRRVVDTKHASLFQVVLVQRISWSEQHGQGKDGIFFKLEEIMSCLNITWDDQVQNNTHSVVGEGKVIELRPFRR